MNDKNDSDTSYSLRHGLDRRRALDIGALGLLILAVSIPAVSASHLPHHFENGDIIDAEKLMENLDHGVIDEDLVISITAGDCNELRDELLTLEPRRIVGGATVTLELASGIYACDGTIRIDHVDGENLQIRGTGNGPEDVVLTFPSGNDGLQVPGGRNVGLIENLTLRGAGDLLGIRGGRGAAVRIQQVIIREFGHGIHVSNGFFSGDDVQFLSNSGWGMAAAAGSTVILSDTRSAENGGGFLANGGAIVHLTGCDAELNQGAGYLAYESTLTAGDCSATDNTGSGFISNLGSTMILTNPTSTGNSGNGVAAVRGGFISLLGDFTLTPNGAGDTNLPLDTPSPTDGTVIADH